MDQSWLCFVAVFLLMIPVIYFGVRSRLRYARRIREAQARGAFVELDTPETKSRVRRLALLAIFGVLGTVFSLLILLQPWIKLPTPLGGIAAIAFSLFVVLVLVSGFLIQREIDRRL